LTAIRSPSEQRTIFDQALGRTVVGEGPTGLVDFALWREVAPIGDWASVLAAPQPDEEKWQRRFQASTMPANWVSKEFVEKLEKRIGRGLELRGPGRPRKKVKKREPRRPGVRNRGCPDSAPGVLGSTTAQGLARTRASVPVNVAFRSGARRRRPGKGYFTARYPTRQRLCQRFTGALAAACA
jgi:hypothetical protein